MPHRPTPPHRIEAEADLLYALHPSEFIRARDARVAELKGSDQREGKGEATQEDKELAQQVHSLRRPTVAGWLVNLLAHRDGLAALHSVGEQLRRAQSELDTAQLRTLASARTEAVAEAVAAALAAGVEADPQFQGSAAVRDQLQATFTAALADPAAQAAVASGRLVTPLQYAGFGEVEIGDAVATPLRSVPPIAVQPEASEPQDSSDDAERAARDEAAAERAARHAAAQAAVDRASAALEVAEAGYAQARARRAQARRALEQARAELADLSSPTVSDQDPR
ncbi:hypothetical protein ACMYYO_14130 [Dermacoccaceae bacterium W4C1]